MRPLSGPGQAGGVWAVAGSGVPGPENVGVDIARGP